jgi:hypothetical protein
LLQPGKEAGDAQIGTRAARSIVLASPPGAGSYVGPGWFREVVSTARFLLFSIAATMSAPRWRLSVRRLKVWRSPAALMPPAVSLISRADTMYNS